MKKLLIEIIDEKALPLLQKMEKDGLIELEKPVEKEPNVEKIADQFRGKLSADSAEKLQQHVEESRSKWSGIFN